MNSKEIKTIAKLSVLLAILTIISAGCGGVRRWNLSLNKPTTASIRVDLLGVTPSEKVLWQKDVKPDDYWKPNSPTRNDALGRMMTNDFQAGATWVVSKTNAIWVKWFDYHATELMIMADLPGGPYSNSESDRRRIFLSLNSKAWKEVKNDTLEIRIEDNFIRVLTKERSHK